MQATGLPGDLAWWREHRRSPSIDTAAARDLLARLQAWKAGHDDDRARQPGPFFKMVWDGVFADDASEVADTIAEIEAALGGAPSA